MKFSVPTTYHKLNTFWKTSALKQFRQFSDLDQGKMHWCVYTRKRKNLGNLLVEMLLLTPYLQQEFKLAWRIRAFIPRVLFAIHMKNCPLWPSDQTLKPPTLHWKIWKIFRAKSCKGGRGNPAQPPDRSVLLVQQGMNQLSTSVRFCHSFHALLRVQGTMRGFTLVCRQDRRKWAFISLSLPFCHRALKKRPRPHPGGRHLAGQGSRRLTAQLQASHKKNHV